MEKKSFKLTSQLHGNNIESNPSVNWIQGKKENQFICFSSIRNDPNTSINIISMNPLATITQ